MDKQNKRILYGLITLSIPTILEEVMSTLLQYVDTAMVGHLGQQATASVSTTTTVNWLVHSIPYSIAIAVMALAAKAYGARDHALVRKIVSQSFLLTLVVGIVLTVVCMALSPFIPIWMNAEQAVQGPASLYFFIISIPMIFRTADAVFGAVIRATKDTKTPMLVNLVANIINIALNALLIYGLHWGVTGAAIASAVSFSFSGVMMMILAWKKGWFVADPKLLHWDKPILRETARISLPALGTSVVSCMGYVVFAGMVSGMGTMIFAAHSIAVMAEQLFYIPGYGLRVATSSLVGNAIGEGDKKKQLETEKSSILLTVGGMVVSGLILYLTANPLMIFFTSDRDVAVLGAEMLRIVALTEPFFGLMIVIEGIFYGQGKSKGIFVIESISMWGIRILFTYLVIHVWGLGLREVWYCMIADNVFKALSLLTVYLYSRRKK